MRRADRLFQLLGILARGRIATGKQLADELEVSVRTVYRDILDLSASGVPILGEAGVGYRLDPSYRLPPMTFSLDEIEALVLGMRMVETWGDADLRTSARAILDKVSAVASPSGKNRLSTTALFSLGFTAPVEASRYLGELRRAVNQHCKVDLEYEAPEAKRTQRRVRPLGLFFWGKSWTLAAWCELRDGFRNFRTDRIRQITVTDDEFALVSPVTLEDYIAAMDAES